MSRSWSLRPPVPAGTAPTDEFLSLLSFLVRRCLADDMQERKSCIRWPPRFLTEPGRFFLMSGLKGLASRHVRLLPCASQKCESQVCESHHATRKFAKRRCARRSARRDGRRRRDVVGLEDAKIVMSVKNPESLVKGSTVRTGIPRRRRPARPMRSGRALRLLWLLSPRASAGPLRPPFLR